MSAAAAGTLPFLSACPPGDPVVDGGPPTRPEVNPDDYDNAVLTAFDADAIAVDEVLFPLGVQAGGMTTSGALLWGYTSDGAPKRLRVWREGGSAGEVALVFDGDVSPDEMGTLHQEVASLAPGTLYQYAWLAYDGEAATGRSTVGQVQTAWPDDWRWPLTLACATCTNWDNAPYEVLEAMAAEDFDVFVHLGDMSYNDGAVTPDEYRDKWRATLADPGYRAILPRAGAYFAWDDHEFTNNLNPETLDPAQLEAARESFFRHVAALEGSSGELWRSFRWGHTAEIFVLDCRTQRRPSEREAGAAAYLGEAQHAWFKQALVDSPCHFKVVLNSVPMANMPPPLWGLTDDRWQGYPEAREEILQLIEDEGIENVWFLSGDFHIGFIGRVGTEGVRRRMWDVAVGPTGNLGNPLALLAEDPENRPLVFPDDQFLYGKGALAQTFLTFDPLAGEVRVRFLRANGEVLYDDVITPET